MRKGSGCVTDNSHTVPSGLLCGTRPRVVYDDWVPDEEEHTKKPPVLHRPIPNRAMEWILIVLVIAVLIFILLPTCSTTRGPHRQVQDRSNINQSINAIVAYATDNDGQLPAHVKLLEEYGLGGELFISPFDHRPSLVFEDGPEQGWYAYGSYWFLSHDAISIEDDNDIMLVYRTPRPDSDYYLVGFLDGRVETMTSDEFKALMKQQEALLPLTSSAYP